MSKVGRSGRPLPRRSNVPLDRLNDFRRNVGRAGMRTINGNNVPKKVLGTFPVATANSKKN